MPRDPVTGTPAIASEEEVHKSATRKNPADLEQDIRRTRADLSETVDEIERRLSPDRLKQEAKNTVQETINEVRDRYNPQRMAERAGRTMLDTVKDHPVPAMIAGLSIGYLFMKAGEGNGRKQPYYEQRRYGYPRRAAYGDVYFEDDYYGGDREPRAYERYEEGYPTDPYYTGGVYERSASYEDERSSVKDRVSEKAGEAKHQASEFADEAKHRAGALAGEAQRRTQQARRQVQHGAHRAGSGFDAFIHENPLAAGAIALGVGAFLGGLLPSTQKENELMGDVRDDVVHRAEAAAEETMDQAKQVAGRVADEAKTAAQEVKETTKHEAQRVTETAKAGASDVQQEAKHQAQQQSKETSR